MVYLSPMTTTSSSSDFPSPSLRCRYCGHEHQAIEDILIVDSNGYPSEQGRPGATVICADEEACNARMARWPQPDHEIDWSDPEPDYTEPEGEPFYCEDHGQDREDGWED